MSNMGRNNDVAHVPAKAGSATSREPLPFRGGLDVAPMPRATVDEVLAKLSWIEDQAKSAMGLAQLCEGDVDANPAPASAIK